MTDWLSIAVYAISPLCAAFGIFVFHSQCERHRGWLYLVAYSPICLFAALRGEVGTDTASYRYFYATFDTLASYWIDPLFQLFQALFHQIGLEVQYFLAAQAILCWLLFSFGAARIDQKLPVLGVGLLPVLLVDATFNGLRYGLAFAVTLMVISQIEKQNSIKSCLISLVPGLFHSSLLILLLTKIRGLLFIVLVVAAVAFLCLDVVEVANSYYGLKVSDYSDMQRPNWFSGAMPICQAIILLYISRKAKCSVGFGSSFFLFSFLLICFSVVNISRSYAFLRFLQIGIFLLAISVSRSVSRASVYAKAAVFCMGLVNIAGFLRIIYNEKNALTPFVPYRFF